MSPTTPEPTIRPAQPSDRLRLVDIWLASVRATHTFLSEPEIAALVPDTTAYLTSDEPDLWVLIDGDHGDDAVVGFMGLAGGEVESLFLAPEYHRRGGGRRMIRFAQGLRGELTVAVNEQNPGGVAFYEACGFVLERRSETDDAGRPYPLLYLRLPASPPDQRERA